MNTLEFLNIKMFWLLSLILLFVACYKYYSVKSLSDLKKFAGALSLNRAKSLRPLKLTLICSAIVFITIALTEPVWRQVPKELRKEGRDLVFILDVSNSMKAQDLIPNRLEKAKISITECVNSLKNHRIGLVIFAGSAVIKCPLTLDYDFFLHILSRIDTNSVEHGGTLIQDAVLKTCDKLFTDSKNGNKDIILISDGGDLGKGVDRAVDAVNEIGAKIITIGVGDSVNGARIPLDKGAGYMKYKGKEVWTKLENEQLKIFSRKCKAGAYLPAGTKQMDLAQIYEQFTQNEQGSSISEQKIMVYKDEYPIFLSIAFVLLFIMVTLPSKLKSSAQKVLPLLLIFLSPSLDAATLGDADKAYNSGKYDEAIRFYIEIVHSYDDQKAEIYFNIANAYYRLGKYEGAISSYRNALGEIEQNSQLAGVVTYNLANALYKSALEAEKIEEAIGSLRSALTYYRRVIMQKPDLKQAVINFELAKMELLKKTKEQEEELKKQQEMQKQLNEIRKLLEKAVKEQKNNIDLTESSLLEKKSIEPLKSPEELILKDTKRAEYLLTDLEKKDEALKELKVFEPSLNHIKNALLNEVAAADFLGKNNDAAVPSEKEAHGSLLRALEALPEEPQQQSSKSDESEDGEEGDESEEEDEDGEEGEDNMAPDTSAEEGKDEQRMDLPNDSIEDILKMEDKLHKLRKAAEKKGRLKKVDKDW